MSRPSATRALVLALALATAVTATSCSSDDDAGSTTTTAGGPQTGATEVDVTSTSTSTSTTTASTTTEGTDQPAGDLPTYEDAKATYLAQADDTTIASCDESSSDEDLYTTTGEATRFECGNFGRFEYYAGAEVYEQNWPSIESDQVYRSVFHVPGELIIVPIGSNDTFAPALAEACGCGEVVEQQG